MAAFDGINRKSALDTGGPRYLECRREVINPTIEENAVKAWNKCRAVMISALALGLAAGVAPQARAEYPDRPITMIIPLAAASAVDNVARLVAQEMGKTLNQSIVVENQPGAAGAIGANRVAMANPDGYTIGGFNDSILAMVPNLTKTPWDPLKSFAPVSLVTTFEWGLIANPGIYKNAGDLIAAAKAHPGRIEYSSGGIGSPQHIAMALFASKNKLDMVHVPYRGATPAAMGVAAGEVKVGLQAVATAKGLVDSKRVDLLGVASDKRLAEMPNVPTISESGSPGFTFSSWFVVVAPAKTPPAMIEKLNAAIKQALQNPAVKAKLAAYGANAVGSSPEELARRTKENYDVYGKLIRDNHIQPE
jgi:tripartite-type tricarboxylate transporter receptor subunit TctC